MGISSAERKWRHWTGPFHDFAVIFQRLDRSTARSHSSYVDFITGEFFLFGLNSCWVRRIWTSSDLLFHTPTARYSIYSERAIHSRHGFKHYSKIFTVCILDNSRSTAQLQIHSTLQQDIHCLYTGQLQIHSNAKSHKPTQQDILVSRINIIHKTPVSGTYI